MPVNVTETAARRIDQIIAEHGFEPSTMKLRVGVKGGGCSGFNYTLDLTEVLKDSDEAWSFTYKRLPATLETSESGGQTATITTTGTATMTATRPILRTVRLALLVKTLAPRFSRLHSAEDTHQVSRFGESGARETRSVGAVLPPSWRMTPASSWHGQGNAG